MEPGAGDLIRRGTFRAVPLEEHGFESSASQRPDTGGVLLTSGDAAKGEGVSSKHIGRSRGGAGGRFVGFVVVIVAGCCLLLVWPPPLLAKLGQDAFSRIHENYWRPPNSQDDSAAITERIRQEQEASRAAAAAAAQMREQLFALSHELERSQVNLQVKENEIETMKTMSETEKSALENKIYELESKLREVTAAIEEAATREKEAAAARSRSDYVTMNVASSRLGAYILQTETTQATKKKLEAALSVVKEYLGGRYVSSKVHSPSRILSDEPINGYADFFIVAQPALTVSTRLAFPTVAKTLQIYRHWTDARDRPPSPDCVPHTMSFLGFSSSLESEEPLIELHRHHLPPDSFVASVDLPSGPPIDKMRIVLESGRDMTCVYRVRLVGDVSTATVN